MFFTRENFPLYCTRGNFPIVRVCLIIKFSLAAPVEKIARRISEALPRSPESSGRRPEARGDLGSASHMRSVGANAGEECKEASLVER